MISVLAPNAKCHKVTHYPSIFITCWGHTTTDGGVQPEQVASLLWTNTTTIWDNLEQPITYESWVWTVGGTWKTHKHTEKKTAQNTHIFHKS